MKNKIGLLLIFLFGITPFCFNTIKAQDHQSALHEVGAPDSLYSKTLQETRSIFVQLPASFNPDSDREYPVVYILDGDVLLPALSTVYDFYYGGFMPEMILIGISNSAHRTRDLTTSVVETRHGRPLTEASGGAANFTQFIEHELIPYVEEKYPVTSFRTLIGHSFGGLFTIHTLLHHRHLFDHYLAIDPSLDWDQQKLLRQAESILAEKDFQTKGLFVSLSGQLHNHNPEVTIDNVMEDTTEFTLFARSNIAFANLVRENEQNGLSFDWEFYPRDLHGTVPLPSILDGLISLFEWFQMENTDQFNSPDTPVAELDRIVNYRADKLERHFGYRVPPYPEELINVLGYMSLEMEQVEKAKLFFEFGLAHFPRSASSYDSMADYYEAQGDKANALKMVAKAYELSGSDYHREKMEQLKADKE